MATCDCCGEREAMPAAIENGQTWCEGCSRDCRCDTCGQNTAEEHYFWEPAECERCAATSVYSQVEEWITDALYAADLRPCGRSGKSRSVYYGRGTDSEGRERIRISDHAVAYACSDCAVCIGIGDGAPDDDVTVPIGATREEAEAAAAKALAFFAARCPETEEEEV